MEHLKTFFLKKMKGGIKKTNTSLKMKMKTPKSKTLKHKNEII
jgi:hypothetical protein